MTVNEKELPLSIIVPVYNVERYLSQCIESILAQKFGKFELILVDDGSTDRSPGICDSFAEKDIRIQVLHTKNEGHVSARKCGIHVARGKYVGFVDSDDWIAKDMYDVMIRHAGKYDADCVVTGFFYYNGSECIEVNNKVESGIYCNEKLEREKNRFLCTGNFFEFGIYPAMWNKITKKEILERHLLRVPEEFQMGEDAMCIFPTLYDCKRIVVINDFFPYYYRNEWLGSMSKKHDRDYFRRIAMLCSSLMDELSVYDEKSRKSVCTYFLYLFFIGLEREMDGIKIKEKKKKISTLLKKYDIFDRMSDCHLNTNSNYYRRLFELADKRDITGMALFYSVLDAKRKLKALVRHTI